MIEELGDLKHAASKKLVHVRIDVSGSPLEFPGACLCNSCVRSNACVVIWSRFGGPFHQIRDLVVMDVFCRGVPEYWKGEGESHEEIDYPEGNCDQIGWRQDD